MMDPRRWEEIRAGFEALVELDPAGRTRGLAANRRRVRLRGSELRPGGSE